MIQAFRGVGKSWITTAYVLWSLLRNPNMNITVVSASQQKANDFTTFALRLINEMPCLQGLIPGKDQRCSKLSFDVGPAKANKDPSVSSFGITSQLTGGRADLIVSDDIEVPSNSETQKLREKLAERIKEFDALLKPEGHVVFLGTPQTESSVYKVLPERGYVTRTWPSEYPDKSQIAKYGMQQAPIAPDIAEDLDKDLTLVGKTTEPGRFSDMDLAERKASYGRAGYALQFLLDTSLSDADRYPLHLSDLLIHNVDIEHGPDRLMWAGTPDQLINDLPVIGIGNDKLYRPAFVGQQTNFSPWQSKVMSIDPSGRGKDETGYAVVFGLNGYLHVPDAGGLKGYDEETLRTLAEIAKKYRVNTILIEANYGDGMFTKLFTQVVSKIYPCGIEEVKHSIQKEKRIIDTVEPIMSSHRLVVDPKVILKDYQSTAHIPTEYNKHQEYRLFYQLTRITKDRGCLNHDDRLDALAIAVAHFKDTMSQDVDENIRIMREEKLRIELERFSNHVFGREPEEPAGWIKRVH